MVAKRIYGKWSILLALMLLPPAVAEAQTLQNDLAFLLQKRPTSETFNIKNETPPAKTGRRQISEAKIALYGAIFVYQTVLSSQDMSTCNFTPSCSRFSRAALEHSGLIRGVLLTSDRLQRCNGLPGKGLHYRFLPAVGKFSDPISRYIDSSAPVIDHE